MVIAVLVSKCIPRVCGDEPGTGDAAGVGLLVFPACAGMSPLKDIQNDFKLSIPRVYGDEPDALDKLGKDALYSPLVRG